MSRAAGLAFDFGRSDIEIVRQVRQGARGVTRRALAPEVGHRPDRRWVHPAF
jgi:hypothetical protein